MLANVILKNVGSIHLFTVAICLFCLETRKECGNNNPKYPFSKRKRYVERSRQVFFHIDIVLFS